MQTNVAFRDFLQKKGIEMFWDEEDYNVPNNETIQAADQ